MNYSLFHKEDSEVSLLNYLDNKIMVINRSGKLYHFY